MSDEIRRQWHDEFKGLQPPRCSTCRHWETQEVSRKCIVPAHLQPCRLVGGCLGGGRGDDVAATDGGAIFWTGPNFGCVHWEAKA